MHWRWSKFVQLKDIVYHCDEFSVNLYDEFGAHLRHESNIHLYNKLGVHLRDESSVHFRTVTYWIWSGRTLESM